MKLRPYGPGLVEDGGGDDARVEDVGPDAVLALLKGNSASVVAESGLG